MRSCSITQLQRAIAAEEEEEAARGGGRFASAAGAGGPSEDSPKKEMGQSAAKWAVGGSAGGDRPIRMPTRGHLATPQQRISIKFYDELQERIIRCGVVWAARAT